MNLPRFAVTHQPVVVFLVLAACLAGIFNLSTMPRREDPFLDIRDAAVRTEWPGAPAERVEELVTELLERTIIETAEVETIRSRSLTGLSIIQITLEEDVADSDQVWDELRAKVRATEAALPSSALPPVFDSSFGDVFEIVFAIYQKSPPDPSDEAANYSARELEVFAERIEEELERIPSVGKVAIWGVQHERIYVEIDSSDLAKLKLTPTELQQVFSARNIVTPGGELNTPRARYAVTPSGEFSTVEQMRELIVERRDGEVPIRLGDLPVSIERRYEEPPASMTRFAAPGLGQRPSGVVAVSMKPGQNIAAMNAAVEQAVEDLRESALPADLAITRINDLPRQVDTRLGDFQFNLLQGVCIVLILALVVMGWRPALIMAASVPVSMLAAIAVMRPLGVELEQIAVASLIIALGLIVDNSIVISDNVVRLISQGFTKVEACVRGAQELALPMLAATATTVFAFLPMLTISGYPGEYILSLPIVVTAALAASYLLAMSLTPLACLWLLKAPTTPDSPTVPRAETSSRLLAFYERTISWSLERRGIVLLATAVAFLLSLGIVPIIGTQFFPSGDRDQFFIKIWLPEGRQSKRRRALPTRSKTRFSISRVRTTVGNALTTLPHISGPVAPDCCSRWSRSSVIPTTRSWSSTPAIRKRPTNSSPSCARGLANFRRPVSRSKSSCSGRRSEIRSPSG